MNDAATPPPTTTAGKAPRWRRILGPILLIVAIVLVPISLTAIWVRGTLLNTDRYVSTVGPLASNPEVQQALATDLTNAIYSRVDVNKKVADALPARGAFLATPIADALKTTIDQGALRLVQSSRFQTLWENANRKAHPKVVKVLTGGGPRVSTAGGTVSINISQIFDNVKTKLDARGITIFDQATLPKDKQEFVLFQSKQLASAQGLVNLLQKLAWVLPFVTILCFAGAILLSKHGRRTVMRGAIGVALAVGVELAGLKAGRNFYLEAVTSKQLPRGAAGAVWDQLVHYLRTWGIVLIVIAILVAIIAWLVGRRSAGGLGASSEHDPVAAVAPFVGHNLPTLRWAGVALAVIALIFWSNPTGWTVIGLVVVLVVYLALIEYLARSAKAERRTPTAGAAT